MRYYALNQCEDRRLIARDGDEVVDITSVCSDLTSFTDLVRGSTIDRSSIDDVAKRHFAEADRLGMEVLESARRPVAPDEIWGAGVTYEISEQAREAESSMPDMYYDAYRDERPEIFFKATASRTVGPGEEVGIRADSDWDVPEPELGVVLYRGETVGYTIGNDVSSRSIEGANPLYLPQAKIYDRCCSIGPAVASPTTVGDPHDLDMRIQIHRDGTTVFEDATSTGEMARTCEDLVSYFRRHNEMPKLAVLLTGTALVPDDEFTLHQGDRIDIEIENVGQLTNTVRVV